MMTATLELTFDRSRIIAIGERLYAKRAFVLRGRLLRDAFAVQDRSGAAGAHQHSGPRGSPAEERIALGCVEAR